MRVLWESNMGHEKRKGGIGIERRLGYVTENERGALNGLHLGENGCCWWRAEKTRRAAVGGGDGVQVDVYCHEGADVGGDEAFPVYVGGEFAAFNFRQYRLHDLGVADEQGDEERR